MILSRSRKRKVEPDVITVEDLLIKNNSPKPWLSDSLSQIELTEAGRGTINMGGQLIDNHINFAEMLKKFSRDSSMNSQYFNQFYFV